MADKAAEFLNRWMGQNVHHHPFPDDWNEHIAALKTQLWADMEAAGLDPKDADDDNLTELLQDQLEAVYDPDAGFHDPD